MSTNADARLQPGQSAHAIIADMENDVRSAVELATVAFMITAPCKALDAGEVKALHRVLVYLLNHVGSVEDGWERVKGERQATR